MNVFSSLRRRSVFHKNTMEKISSRRWRRFLEIDKKGHTVQRTSFRVYKEEAYSRRTRWRRFHPQDGNDSWKLIKKETTDTWYKERPFESTRVYKEEAWEPDGDDFIHKIDTILENW